MERDDLQCVLYTEKIELYLNSIQFKKYFRLIIGNNI